MCKGDLPRELLPQGGSWEMHEKPNTSLPMPLWVDKGWSLYVPARDDKAQAGSEAPKRKRTAKAAAAGGQCCQLAYVADCC